MKLKIVLLSLFAIFHLVSCSSAEVYDTATAEGAFKQAEKFEKNERYEEALAGYSNVKNKHPYSSYAIESKLKIADIHFEREAYLEAENAYKLFKEFHPKHARIDYVTYRLGMSYFMQLPSTIDRDLNLADDAILYFDEVISSYPNSEFVEKAKEHRGKALSMLAEKEYYIANFYFIRDMYDSSLTRFEDLLRRYPSLGFDAKALYGASYSAYKVKNMNKARLYYNQLVASHPDSDERKKIQGDIGDEL